MIAGTHITFGLFFSLMLVTLLDIKLNLSIPVYIFGIIGAVLPDIDNPRAIIGRILWPISSWLDRAFGHRTVTHSLFGWLICSVISVPLLLLKKEYYLFLVFGYLSHILIDMANIKGVLLFWPSRRQHIFGSNRMPTGDNKETSLAVLFIGLTILTLPLSKYGLRTAMGYMLGNHGSASSLMLQSDKRMYLDFEAIDAMTRKKMSGKAMILDRVGDKYFVIVYQGKVYTISDYGDVDLISSKERIDYTEEPDKREKINLKYSTYKEMLAHLPQNSYFNGTLIYPLNYYYSFDNELNERITQKKNQLELNFVSKAELEKMIWKKYTESTQANYYYLNILPEEKAEKMWWRMRGVVVE